VLIVEAPEHLPRRAEHHGPVPDEETDQTDRRRRHSGTHDAGAAARREPRGVRGRVQELLGHAAR